MKTLKEKIEVMQAALDGKQVEFKFNGSEWGRCLVNPNFGWTDYDYRIKPEPLELWVNVVDDYTSSINWATERRPYRAARNAQKQ